MSQERSYYVARAEEECRLAIASNHPKVRKVHMEMAARYVVLARDTAIEEFPPERPDGSLSRSLPRSPAPNLNH